MGINRAPSFQFYPKDWLDFRVQRMSLEAQGAYLKLLCFMWKDGPRQSSILDDNDLLARAIGTTVANWRKLRAEIQQKNDPIFIEKDGHLHSKRLRGENMKQAKYRKQQAQKGKMSAQQRLNRGSTVAQPEGKSSSSSSSSNRGTNGVDPPKYPGAEEIVQAWQQITLPVGGYPRRAWARAATTETITKHKREIEDLCELIGADLLIAHMKRIHSEAPENDKPSVVNYFLKPWRQEFHDELVVAQAKKEHAAKQKKGDR